jgi:hypothetical protein
MLQVEAEEAVDNQMVLKPPMLRALQELAGSGRVKGVTYVETPQELQAAVDEGARHIEITQHLDLTVLAVRTIYPRLKIEVQASTLSIRVRPSSTSSSSSSFSSFWRNNFMDCCTVSFRCQAHAFNNV